MSSINQPKHRRPSYAQTETAYRCIMRNNAASANRSPPGTDFGSDNFSYYPEHLVKFAIDKNLVLRLPNDIKEPIEDWQCAGAALDSAIERLYKTFDDQAYRGYPEKKHGHLARTPSNVRSSSAVGSDSTGSEAVSPTELPESFMPIPKPAWRGEQLPPTNGMDTPPFTPVDSGASPTPVIPANGTKATPPDLQRINKQLSSSPPPEYISRRKDSLTPLGSPGFDENAWERYLNSYRVELEDVKITCYGRFNGAGKRIHQLQTELAQDPAYTDVMMEFAVVWNSMKRLIAAYETKVQDLPFPSKTQMWEIRRGMGFPL
ncbi:hypothetical protein MBLNU230_g7963t1 [Neophaeotheca triangularis]